MLYDLKYKLDGEGIKIMAGCASTQLIQEIHDAVSNAFSEIILTVDYDPEWGFVRPVAVNNRQIEND